LIKLNPQIGLDGSELSQTLLLSNCPRLTNICLEELASNKEMVGLNMGRTNVKAIAKVLIQADILSLVRGRLILQLYVGNPRIPSHLSSGEKKDIAQRRVKGMRVRHSEKGLILPVNDDVLWPRKLVSITNNNNSDLIDSGIREIVAMPVTVLIKVKRDLITLFRRHKGSHLICLLIKVNSRMRLMKDALK